MVGAGFVPLHVMLNAGEAATHLQCMWAAGAMGHGCWLGAAGVGWGGRLDVKGSEMALVFGSRWRGLGHRATRRVNCRNKLLPKQYFETAVPAESTPSRTEGTRSEIMMTKGG